MKYRSSFVTNSSSSSFVISKEHLTPLQIELIRSHWEAADTVAFWEDKVLGLPDGEKLIHMGSYSSEYDRWDISEDETHIAGYTSMDNFDMEQFLTVIGVDPSVVEWGE